MASQIISNIISILIAIALVFSMKLEKKYKHLLHGVFLIILGSINLLFYYNITGFSIPDAPIVVYSLNIIVAVSGTSLVVEGFKEKSAIKWLTIVLGFAIIFSTIIPTLYGLNAITFNIPSYPQVINYFIYLVAGFLLFIAVSLVGD